MNFPYFPQLDAKDCGPACLRMIAKYHGKSYSLASLRERSYLGKSGVSLLGISEAAESIGLRTLGVKIGLDKIMQQAPLPCILHWKQNHFVVLYKIKGGVFWIADPARGLLKYSEEDLKKYWISAREKNEDVGVALLLEPLPEFYASEDEKSHRTKFSFLFQYLRPHRKLLIQLMLGMFLGSVFQLIFPLLTQSVVDKGVIVQDLGFIYMVLIAQFVLIIGRTSVDFIRNWIVLHLSTRINISLISDFLIKLLRLPLKFFDNKLIGDLMQRIGDHSRIQSFLTSTSVNILFGAFNLVIFSLVLAFYQWKILAVFVLGSLVYFLWVCYFLKKRREIDYQRFALNSDNFGTLIQIFSGIQDIKINNCERNKRWDWEKIQARLFHTQVRGLNISQYQQVGGLFFNETKNILITFLSAYSVLKGDMTLGMMVAVQYIIGQMNSPIDQMVGFLQSAQDARISLERLGEIHQSSEEKSRDTSCLNPSEKASIIVRDVSFQYDGPHSPYALYQVSFDIPYGKTTAIVGASGSGKTTLMKLLLGFYQPVSGDILLGEQHLNSLDQAVWFSKCGAVLQDGYIFSDTIAGNIAMSDEETDTGRLLNAAGIANIDAFVRELPLSYNTHIGMDGGGLSQGQKQRILIARALYKGPDYLFLDEATNALDADNEKTILDKLKTKFTGKTLVVIAHRFSTLKHADQIIVMEKGKIAERGRHEDLVESKGIYYHLIKNQLELNI